MSLLCVADRQTLGKHSLKKHFSELLVFKLFELALVSPVSSLVK